jgi:hypothetical protein
VSEPARTRFPGAPDIGAEVEATVAVCDGHGAALHATWLRTPSRTTATGSAGDGLSRLGPREDSGGTGRKHNAETEKDGTACLCRMRLTTTALWTSGNSLTAARSHSSVAGADLYP